MLKSLSSSVAIVTFLLSAPVFAQDNSTLPADGGDDDAIIVTASRSGDAIRTDQIGASVTILDTAALEQRGTRIVSDILRDVPGIAVSRLGAIGGFTQIRVRGAEANQVLVLIDGIKASDPYYGEYDFGTLIADDSARIEVLRGQQSALYGSDAIGGVIHYITLTGAEAPGISARAEGGSFGTFNGAARVAGVSGNLDYALSSSYNHTKGSPTARGGTRDIGSDIAGLSGKLIWTASDTFRLTAVGRYSYTDADNNDMEFDTASPRFGYVIDIPGMTFRNEAFYGLVRGELSLLDGRWTTALSGQIADTTRKNYTAFGFDGGDKGKRAKGSLESTFRFGTDRIAHRLTGALDIEREQFQNTQPSPFTFQGKRHTDNVGIVGQYDVVVDEALALGASIRRDENDRFDDTTTYRFQGSYKLPTGTRVRGAYGTGVKNPGYYELYGFSTGRYIANPNLKPEKSKGWEAGIEQSFADDFGTVSVTYFDSKLTNEIFATFASSSNRTTESKQHGIEFSASARPMKQLRFDLAYTWLHARENSAVEVRRPRSVASFNTTLMSKDERFSGTVTVRYNGEQRDVAFTNPSFVPVPVVLKEYILVNLNADYKLTESVSLFARVENLLDENYEEVFSYATQGRAAYGGVRVRF